MTKYDDVRGALNSSHNVLSRCLKLHGTVIIEAMKSHLLLVPSPRFCPVRILNVIVPLRVPYCQKKSRRVLTKAHIAILILSSDSRLEKILFLQHCYGHEIADIRKRKA